MSKAFDLNRLLRPSISNLKPYSSARDEYTGSVNDMILLDANESPFDTGVNRYPDPRQRQLKEVISGLKGVSRGNILLGNGSDEVLDLLFRAFCEPGVDNCITLPPTYGMYKVLAGINNVENREVLLSNGFQPEVPGIEKAIDDRSKLLFVCSPNNPTGNTMDAGTIRTLLKRFEGIVVMDEAYIDFTETNSWLNELGDFENLVVVQTLSKAHGMAGIRLGICYASAAIIDVLNRIKAPYNVNELTIARAIEGLRDTGYFQERLSMINSEKKQMQEKLDEIEFIEEVFPSEANFLLIRVDDANLRYDQLIEKGVVVRNRHGQPLCENTLRITIGTPEENYRLIQILQTI